MFKSAKSKKEKIKAVFEMQFQATQVPQLKAKGLILSLVPADAGRPTVKLGKAAIIDGTCSWDNTIYETMKLERDSKAGKFQEKIYYFIVATKSSKSGFLGEVGMDFAELAEMTEPVLLSLPLMPADSGIILHVTVQKMQAMPDQRCKEESVVSRTESFDQSFETELECDDYCTNSTEGEQFNKTSLYPEQNGTLRHPPSDDISVNQDLSSHQQDFRPQKPAFGINSLERYSHQRSSTDCSLGSTSDGSIKDTTNRPKEDIPRDIVQETETNSTLRLQNQIKMLERQAEVSEIELQCLRKQIVKESKRGQDFLQQIFDLQDERDALKTECDELKFKNRGNVQIQNAPQSEIENLTAELEGFRQELQHEKQLRSKLKLKLQKTEDSNSELILRVRDLNEMLDQKKKEISYLSGKRKSEKCFTEGVARKMSNSKSDQNEEENTETFKKVNELEEMKQTIEKMSREIEVYKKESEELKVQKDQLVSDCEILKNENKDIYSELEQSELEKVKLQQEYSEALTSIKQLKVRVEGLEDEMQRQSMNYSESLDTISMLETEVMSLEKELKKQARAFEENLEAATQARVVQEQRALGAEEALRRTRSNNANATEQLQQEIRRLSVEMASKVDEKEKLAIKAAAEANALLQQNKVLEDSLHEAKKELESTKDHYTKELHQLSIQNNQTLLEESNKMQTLMDEKKKSEEHLQYEIEKLQVLYNELVHGSEQLKLENENLKEQVFELQSNLHKKGQENRPSNGVTVEARQGTGECIHCGEMRSLEGSSLRSKEINSGMPEVINGHAETTHDLAELLMEVASLRDRNKHMEGELKEMEERYSEISLKFAEVEGERQQLVMALRNLKNGKKN
nr:early endosome antigen 1 isoform X1 [Ipomoea batatas]